MEIQAKNSRTLLFAVRHGETEWNQKKIMQGHLNSPLTELGIKQAEAIAERLSSQEINFIYSSDLGRAVHTAEIISSQLGLDFTKDCRLREGNLGIMQGLTRTEFAEKHPDENQNYFSGNPDYVIPEGESVRQRYERCIAGIEELTKLNLSKNILIVAHGGVLKSMFYRALNLSLSDTPSFSLFNASINTFAVTNGEWQLNTWGDVHHLQNMKTLDLRL